MSASYLGNTERQGTRETEQLVDLANEQRRNDAIAMALTPRGCKTEVESSRELKCDSDNWQTLKVQR